MGRAEMPAFHADETLLDLRPLPARPGMPLDPCERPDIRGADLGAPADRRLAC